MKAEFAHVQGYTEDGKLGGRMKASRMNRRECSPESTSSNGESWTDMIMRETHSSRYDTVKDAPCHAKEGINREVLEARSIRDETSAAARVLVWAADQKVSLPRSRSGLYPRSPSLSLTSTTKSEYTGMAEHQAMYTTDEVRDLLPRTKTGRSDEV